MKARAVRKLLFSFAALFAAAQAAGCYSSGDGLAPPPERIYFPVGLAVSSGGNALYVANSDFDLQWNGGTLQSFNLFRIKRDALKAIENPADPSLPRVFPNNGICPDQPATNRPDGTRTTVGETCAPIVDSTFYFREAATIGAFATDLQIAAGKRIFVPVRGNASLTWADVATDDPNGTPPEDRNAAFEPFRMNCGLRSDGNRCARDHEAGSDPNEVGNTRKLTLPGEPFGIAISEDARSIVMTHQTSTRTSLFSSGLFTDSGVSESPSLQFIEEDVTEGGNGVASIPHCFAGAAPNSRVCVPKAPKPSYLQTSRAKAELTLLRYYSDEGGTFASSLRRPFLVKERTFPVAVNSSGTDSRGIAVDSTARLRCLLNVAPAGGTRTGQDVGNDQERCVEIPLRVFLANRAPASLVIGEIGGRAAATEGFDSDRLVLQSSVPLSAGPSRVFLAPIVDKDGRYALRVFVVCFDAALVYVYDPETRAVENILRVAPGPFAMAFDPFTWEDVAQRSVVPVDTRDATGVRRYRFGYLGSFQQSFFQVLDLDNAIERKDTYQTIVLNVGTPHIPRGVN